MIRLCTSCSLVTKMTSTREPESGKNSIWRNTTASLRGTVTIPAICVTLDNKFDAASIKFVISACVERSPRRRLTSCFFSGVTVSNESINIRYPVTVGTLPADVWGERIRPHSSRSDMTFLIVAGLRFTSDLRESARDPTG